ncbi:MAG: cytochrome C oxidase Cbb3 [Acidobacteria bacterium]|nr:cytochrome C oxidase Cbb3 [Acidobacteriota bacterium]
MRQLTAAGLTVAATVLFAGAVGAQELTGHPWSDMDYGPFKVHSYIVEPGNNANKGIAIRLDEGPGGVAKGAEFLLFDTDTLRWAAGWTGPGLMDWNSINYNGRHVVEPAIVGDMVFTNPDAPGWSLVADDFRDTRIIGRGGRRFGPQDSAVARWLGQYLHGDQVVLHYRIGDAEVLELGASEGGGLLSRTLNIGPREADLFVQVAHQPGGQAWSDGEAAGFRMSRPNTPERGERGGPTIAALVGAPAAVQWVDDDGDDLRLRVPASDEPVRFKVVIGRRGRSNAGFLARAAGVEAAVDLTALTRGGPARWTETVTTESRVLGRRNGPFELEAITTPLENPYRSWMRLGGFDFLDGGKRAVVATWMGDVWIVDGLGGEEIGAFTWKRFATGMYEPLGVNTRGGEIFVTSRDQITRLRDLNGDGEADHYEAFNHDAQASAHFHEFAVGLETDAEGNFYYAKGAGHDFDARVPQHGTILKVAADGSSTEIIANGFRAPNGLVVNPDGSVIVTDQEGHWIPENRINWIEPGTFHGYMRAWRQPDREPDDFVQPVTWIHHDVDRSPSAPVWVRSHRWGELDDSLIYLSYGNGKMFSVLFDEAFARVAFPEGDGPPRQAAVTELPVTAAPTGLIRGRFNSADDHLYVCGLFAWAGDRTQPGGFYRVRRTEQPLRVPNAYETASDGIVVRFTSELDPETAADPGNYSMRIWQYVRQASYGSEDYRVLGEGVGEDDLAIPSATLSEDGRSVFIEIPDILPVQQYHLEMNLRSADGERIREFIHGTIHELGTRAGAEILAGSD